MRFRVKPGGCPLHDGLHAVFREEAHGVLAQPVAQGRAFLWARARHVLSSNTRSWLDFAGLVLDFGGEELREHFGPALGQNVLVMLCELLLRGSQWARLGRDDLEFVYAAAGLRCGVFRRLSPCRTDAEREVHGDQSTALNDNKHGGHGDRGLI